MKIKKFPSDSKLLPHFICDNCDAEFVPECRKEYRKRPQFLCDIFILDRFTARCPFCGIKLQTDDMIKSNRLSDLEELR